MSKYYFDGDLVSPDSERDIVVLKGECYCVNKKIPYMYYFFQGKRFENNIHYSEHYHRCWDYCEGFGVVQEDRYGYPMRYRDENGKLSERFHKCFGYSNGFGRVQKDMDGPMQYRDTYGNLSEEFYECWDYSNGFGRVQKNKGGPFQYRDLDGNLSEEFYKCDDYCDGFAVVRKTKDFAMQYRDTNGNLSEKFHECYSYEWGFGYVDILLDDNYENVEQWAQEYEYFSGYRDMLGNLTDDTTEKGEDIFHLSTGEKSVYDICDDCFLDPKAINEEHLPNGETHLVGFIVDVLKREYERCIQATGGKNADTKAQIKQTKQYFRDCVDYCAYKMEQVRSESYEQKQRRKITDEKQAKDSALKEDILTF